MTGKQTGIWVQSNGSIVVMTTMPAGLAKLYILDREEYPSWAAFVPTIGLRWPSRAPLFVRVLEPRLGPAMETATGR